MTDFDNTTDIECSYYLDLWGPYLFTFPIATGVSANDGAIPYLDTIDSVTVRAFTGKVTRKSTLADETEISTDLVDPAFVPDVLGDNVVRIKLQYPGTDYKGQKATLLFEVTTTELGKKDWYFHYVQIR
jgi:hypothetical protein